jgi:predicted MPP superfamily phosphohydrolase
MKRHHRWRKVGISALVLGATLLVGYAFLIEPNQIEITEHKIGDEVANERPIRVVQLSDLHLRSIGRRERAVAIAVNRTRPDLILLTGDVIERLDGLSVLDDFLTLLGPYAKVAVLGNWEHWAKINRRDLRDLYETKHATKLLVNAAANYQFGDRKLNVIGLDDFTAGRPDLGLLQNLPEGIPTIVVQHSPGFFQTPAFQSLTVRATLCIAGHTHGGQVAFFGRPFWTPKGSGDFIAGPYEHPVCPIYVSRGVGTSIAPIRFGAKPEIAVFQL